MLALSVDAMQMYEIPIEEATGEQIIILGNSNSISIENFL